MKNIMKYSFILIIGLSIPYMLYGQCLKECGGNCMAEKADAFAQSVPEKMMYLLSVDDVAKAMENGEDLAVIDIRPPDHYNNGHIKGSMNIPLPVLVEQIEKVPEGKKLAVVCALDTNSAFAVAILQMYGFDAWIMQGGVSGWEEMGKSLVK
jgi:rhodanese-related sulfurtransferase